MSEYARLVEAALQATEIRSATQYSWFGQLSQDVPPEIAAAMGPDNARAFLLHNLQMCLYNDFYCPGQAIPELDASIRFTVPVLTPFVQALSAANRGRGAREPGWTFRGHDSGRLVISRDGLRVWADRRDIFTTRKKLVPGTYVTVRMPKELLKLSPGYYMALGETEFPIDGTDTVVRFYWNLRSEAATQVVAAATSELNRVSVPFRLKVVNEPDRYTRCDAGVLYVTKKHFGAAAPVVRSIYDHVAAGMKPLTPVFTKPLAPGLGFAEDPGDGDSFGMSRCRLLAEAMVRAFEHRQSSLSDRFDQVERCFTESAINLESPYLNAGSVDHYRFPNGAG